MNIRRTLTSLAYASRAALFLAALAPLGCMTGGLESESSAGAGGGGGDVGADTDTDTGAGGGSGTFPAPEAAQLHPSVPISPTLYGQNYWNPGAITPAVMKVAGASGVKLIRIGGIGFNNVASAANAEKWIKQIRDNTDAQPMVQVSNHGPDAAAKAKQLVNALKKYDVKFWEIGNEPDGEWKGSPDQKAAQVENYTKAIATAMREADPDIKIYGPAMTYFDEDYYKRWIGGQNDITGKIAGTNRYFLDGITFHLYPFSGTQYTRADALKNAHNWKKRIEKLTGWIGEANVKHKRTGGAALTWGVSEFNIDSDDAPVVDNSIGGLGSNSFLNGQYFAETFSWGMRNNAKFMLSWCIYSNSNAQKGLGFLTGPTGDGTVTQDNLIRRSSYHHTKLMTQYFKGTSLSSESSMEDVPAIVARDNGQIAVMVLNETKSAHSYAIRLNGEEIAGDHDAKIQVWAGIDKKHEGTIGAETTLVLLLNATNGNLVKKLRYSIGDAKNNKAPHTP